MRRSYNPYKRIEEINEKLNPFELEEKEFMKKKYKIKPKRYCDIEREIFFLAIEKIQIEKVINYFKEEFSKVEKKYPEHYWRWQFYAKILSPDKVIPFVSSQNKSSLHRRSKNG